MPFGSLETAKLYIKAAEIMIDGVYGIYELLYKRGDKRYRVFKSVDALKKQLKNNKNVRCENYEPVYISKKHMPVAENRIRRLTGEEVRHYLADRKKMGIQSS